MIYGVLYRGAENRVGEVLQTMVRRKEVGMEVNIEEIRVNIKLKLPLVNTGGNQTKLILPYTNVEINSVFYYSKML